MTDSSERRSETRIEEKTTVFVEVCSASFDNSSPANVIICNSLDISANGIQVEMDEEVAIGTILRICAEFSNSDKALYLVGETKWVKQEEDHFNIGFELYEAEDTDIAGWKEVIAGML
ncbi:PilZ domain-containing protein [Oceanicoccus sp. KOV_DT_Chl]|uniref:PilZ domain-containing protein n=1 Tax=Oceanicoccus sp. KOV_DT_Chl TaxID=1904639 RepID=UPI000C7E5237|nr:PilZ domain-containing protein [Oceanicoccus sp. KOV_DT_Chl]